MECVALKAAVVLLLLVLQKPSRSSKNEDHVVCIERRLSLWLDGSLSELIKEGRAIQHRLPNSFLGSQWKSSAPATRRFAQKMFQGKTKAALDILKSKKNGRCFAVG